MNDIGYGTGRIYEIINYLKQKHNTDTLAQISYDDKLNALCASLDLSYTEIDDLIVDNPPVLRTVKGHVFETYFDSLIEKSGYPIHEVGGDDAIDRIVNNYSLQLKTPTVAGTKGNTVQYKTHKTHGAKSEQESMDYYHQLEHFADYLVGLISYNPLRIIFISKKDLPTHHRSANHIRSPFSIDWNNHPGLNAFDRVGVPGSDISTLLLPSSNGYLPKSSQLLQVTSEVIIDTILNEKNFRIWDMSIRGFAREIAFEKFAKGQNLKLVSPQSTKRKRADKSDHALFLTEENKYIYFQMKGVSTNNCSLITDNLIIATETQLTRGRVNDHPTQSRLYLKTDFDFLIIGLDPPLTYLLKKLSGKEPELKWKFYCIPIEELDSHHKMNHRLKSLQKFKYADLEQYLIREDNIDQHWQDHQLSLL